MFFLVTAVSMGSAFAATIEVPAGKSSIQAGIDAAAPGDTVLVAPGTYLENIDFKGKAITVTSSGGASVTTIDGKGAGPVVSFESGETGNSVLNGFTIRNGDGSYSQGGGINIAHSSPSITNNTITGNQAYNGGGIYVEAGSPIISGNIITQNPWGGGIYILAAGSAQIIGNEISGNVSGDGGGITLFSAGTTTIRGNVIKENTGSYAGGIHALNESNSIIVQNLVVENHATSSDGAGGISFLVPASLSGPTLLNNTIAGNDGPRSSGILLNGFLSHTKLTNNLVQGTAGHPALYCDGTYNISPPILSHNLAYSPSGSGFGGTCASLPGTSGNLQADPRLSGNYYPLPGSPAIDSADGAAPLLPSSDLDGHSRNLDGDGDGTSTVDIGAYEADPSGPRALITSGPAPVIAVKWATVVIGGNSIVSFRYSLDGQAFSSTPLLVDYPLAIPNLTEGPHTLSVIGKTADGREQLPSAATTVSWTVDTIAPGTTITPPGTYLDSVSVGLGCNDGDPANGGRQGSGCDKTFYCLGAGCTPTTVYNGQPIGISASTELSYYSVDKAGNTESKTTASYVITFPDTSSPVVDNFSIPAVYTTLTFPVTLYASDDRAVAGYCIQESDDPASCNWTSSAPTSYTLGDYGSHTLYAFARDAAGNLSASASATTTDDPSFIPAAGRTDMVYDNVRGILFITSGDSILRYQLRDKTFLTPFKIVGSRLAGIDLSPDRATLAAADFGFTGIHLIDAGTGISADVPFTAETSEGGTYSVAFGGDGAVLVSTQFQGSGGQLPLRRYDLPSGEIKIIDHIGENAMLSASAAGSCIAYTSGNNSGGPVGLYDVGTQTITRKGVVNWSTYQISANRDCTQFAVPTYGGTFILDQLLKQVTTIGKYAEGRPVDAIYHPMGDTAFFAWAGSSEVRATDSKSFAETESYNFVDTFSGDRDATLVSSRLKMSRDGGVIFAAVNGGIRFQVVKVTPIADNQAATTYVNQPAILTLDGRSPVHAPLTYRILTSPQHGTLGGTPPAVTYTPATDYSGDDAFTFDVSDGSNISAPANVRLTVRRDESAPYFVRLTIPSTSNSLTVPVDILAGDDVAVGGYCLAEGDAACTWQRTPPTSYTFSTPGTKLLRVAAIDQAGNVTTVTATVTIASSGYHPPVISSFSAPSFSSSMTVKVSLVATDNVAVTGYCLTEAADATGCTWSSYAPESYSFGSYGVHQLSAFARDEAGNVSAPARATVVITGPKNFIPAAERSDMVYDSTRDLLYIASGMSVLRYRLASNTFLPPYQFNNNLTALDLSQDGKTLAVADQRLTGVHIVDLQTDTIKPDITFTPIYGEGGGYSVAFGKDGALLVATRYGGSGSTPLRRVEPDTGKVTLVSRFSTSYSSFYEALLSSGGNGSCIGYTESHISSGPVGIYDVASQAVTHAVDFSSGTNTSNSGIASNRDCSQFAVTSGSGTFLFDGRLNKITQISQPAEEKPMGAVYSPSSDAVFFSWTDSSEIRVYDTTTLAQTASYDLGIPFNSGTYPAIGDGRLKMSADGSTVFAAVKGGISYLRLSGNAVADDQSVATYSGTPVSIYLTGRNLPQQPIYKVVNAPAHGTISGTAPSLVYTPAANFSGQDSFTFTVGVGSATSNVATITIAVHGDSTPPVITSFATSYPATSMTVPVTSFTATDDVDVKWYCLSESGSSLGCLWSATTPVSYTFGGAEPPQGSTVTRTLYAFVKDSSFNVSSPWPTVVTITIPDTTAPRIVGYEIPASHIGLTMPLAVLGADNLGIFSYCLSESSSPAGCNWTAESPAAYSFTSGGPHTLYAFARDTAGNVSTASARDTVILLPPSFTSPAQATFEIGQQQGFMVTTGGYPPPAIRLTAGNLPAGITFTDNGNGTGTLGGNAAADSAGVYTVTFTASNGVLDDASQEFTITVVKPTMHLVVSTLADGAVTSSPVLNVSGTANSYYGIRSVKVNGTAVALSEDGRFSVPLNLVKGNNTINVTATDTIDRSASDHRTVILDADAPALTVTAPQDGIATSNPFIEITGSADPAAAVLYLADNCLPPGLCGRPLVASRSGANFSATVNLLPGQNTIQIGVLDPTWKESSVKRTIFYYPAFSLSITDPESDMRTGSTDFLLKGAVANNSTPVTISVNVDDKSYSPAVTNGTFEQRLTLDQEKVYQVTVTGTDQGGHKVSVTRNITRVWFGDSTGGSNGSGDVQINDVMHVMELAEGRSEASTTDMLRFDTAPLSAGGKPLGDGNIDIADVIMALRKAIGVTNW